MKENTKSQGNGFKLRLTQAILYLLGALAFLIYGTGGLISTLTNENYTKAEFYDSIIFSIIFYGVMAVFVVLTIIQFIITYKGRKSVGANTVSIVIGALFVVALCYGLPGLLGGIKGRKALLKSRQEKVEAYSENNILQGAETVAVNGGAVNKEGAASATDSAPNEKAAIQKLDLEDVSIHEKEWKEFRKTASQEELLILAIGSKYRLRTSIIKSLLFAIGLVLSVVVGLCLLFSTTVGLVILIGGYLIFAFLSSKHIRYQDTFNQINRKLDKENKLYMKSVFKYSAGMTVLDIFLKFALMWLTIPYQALMLVLGMIAPNFTIAKNGVLVSVPKGYGLENLIDMGEYYKKYSLLDEMIETQKNSTNYIMNHFIHTVF